jgi:ethanolamine transporter EutH
LVSVIAWLVALTLCGAVVGGVVLAIREPIRSWRRQDRRDALIGAIAVTVTVPLMILIGLSHNVP